MSWHDRKAPAHFKGRPFYVDTATLTQARRVVAIKLAGRDGSITQDLGRDSDEFDVTAYLAGKDYDWDRDDLLEALTEKGPGTLVLPTFPEMQVSVIRGPSVTESDKEGGYCTIRFTCIVEERASKRPRIPDTKGILDAVSAAMRAAATVDFASKFDAIGLPGKYLASVTNAISNLTSNLRRISGKIAVTTNGLSDIGAALDELDREMESLIAEPTRLANGIQNVIRSVAGLADHTEQTIDVATGLPTSIASSAYALSETVRLARQASIAGLGAEVPGTGATDLAQREADSTRAIYRLARAESLASLAEIYANAIFDSSALALETLEFMNAEIDALAQYSPTDAFFDALQDMRAALIAYLIDTAAELPRVVSLTIHPSVPSLVLAQERYDNAAQEGEITARNKPKYPLFMSGEIELLE